MKGEDLIKAIQDNPSLRYGDVKETIKWLLKKQLIKPSALIDAQVENLTDEQYVVRCHFEDCVVSAIQLFGGNYEGKFYEDAKKRFFYNTSFSKRFPNLSSPEKLSEEDKKYWSDFFHRTYGFRPEEE